MAWVSNEIMPHEPAVRCWLRRAFRLDDGEDVIQEAYARIASLSSIDHIRDGRAYLFKTTRMLCLERIRKSQVVRIDAIADLQVSEIAADAPSPERVVVGRGELARVCRLIEMLPARRRRIFKLRKIEGLPQREVARVLGVAEHTVENDLAKGLRFLLTAIATGEEMAEKALVEAHMYESRPEYKRDH